MVVFAYNLDTKKYTEDYFNTQNSLVKAKSGNWDGFLLAKTPVFKINNYLSTPGIFTSFLGLFYLFKRYVLAIFVRIEKHTNNVFSHAFWCMVLKGSSKKINIPVIEQYGY